MWRTIWILFIMTIYLCVWCVISYESIYMLLGHYMYIFRLLIRGACYFITWYWSQKHQKKNYYLQYVLCQFIKLLIALKYCWFYHSVYIEAVLVHLNLDHDHNLAKSLSWLNLDHGHNLTQYIKKLLTLVGRWCRFRQIQ